MQLLRALAVLTALGLLAAACGDGDDADDVATPTASPTATQPADPTPEPDQPISPASLITVDRAAPAPSADPRLAAEAMSAFGFELHGALDDEAASADNLVASPASVAIALAMLEPGTVGDGQTQIRELLGIDDPTAFHESMNALEQSLESRVPPESRGDEDPGEIELAVANAAYLQQGYPFEPMYLDTIGTHYGPVLNEVDFVPDPDAVAHEINDFVADVTRDRIPELIPDGAISRDTVLALVNALYMKASWSAPFDGEATADAAFTLLDGTEVDVPMMMGFASSSARGDGWVGAGKGLTGDLVAQFVLPDEGMFDQIEDRIGDVFAEYDRNRTDGSTLAMPRFETRFAVQLDAALRSLGLTAVYDEGHLLGIADDPRLVVDKALHETFVAVDEEGLEVAAATAILAAGTSAPLEPPVPVVLDRPFLFRVVDLQTGATLFLGRIVDPLAGA